MPTRAKTVDEQQAELMWMAGFIDGEGCLAVQRTKHIYDQFAYFQARITVGQISRAPLDLFAARFGGSVHPQTKSNGRVYYFWGLYGKKAVACLGALRPFLRVKNRQADLLLELSSIVGTQGRWIRPETYARRQAIWVEVRHLNAGNSPRRAERLSELAPQLAGDATVRTHGKDNRERQGEIPVRLKAV